MPSEKQDANMKFNLMRYGRGHARVLVGDTPSLYRDRDRDRIVLAFIDSTNRSNVATHYIEMDQEGLNHLEKMIAEIKARDTAQSA